MSAFELYPDTLAPLAQLLDRAGISWQVVGDRTSAGTDIDGDYCGTVDGTSASALHYFDLLLDGWLGLMVTVDLSWSLEYVSDELDNLKTAWVGPQLSLYDSILVDGKDDVLLEDLARELERRLAVCVLDRLLA